MLRRLCSRGLILRLCKASRPLYGGTEASVMVNFPKLMHCHVTDTSITHMRVTVMRTGTTGTTGTDPSG